MTSNRYCEGSRFIPKSNYPSEDSVGYWEGVEGFSPLLFSSPSGCKCKIASGNFQVTRAQARLIADCHPYSSAMNTSNHHWRFDPGTRNMILPWQLSAFKIGECRRGGRTALVPTDPKIRESPSPFFQSTKCTEYLSATAASAAWVG